MTGRRPGPRAVAPALGPTDAPGPTNGPGGSHRGCQGKGRRGGFTLIETAAIAAALVIVLGLMVSLARYARARSAEALTRGLLAAVDRSLDRYVAQYGVPPPLASPLAGPDGATEAIAGDPSELDDAPDLVGAERTAGGSDADEVAVRAAAAENNRRFVRAMRGVFIRSALAAETRRRSGDDGGATTTRPASTATTASAATTATPLPEPIGGGGSAVPFAGLPTALYDERTLRDAWGSPIAYMPARDPRVGTAPGDRPFAFSAGPDRRYLTRGDNVYSYESAPAPTRPLGGP